MSFDGGDGEGQQGGESTEVGIWMGMTRMGNTPTQGEGRAPGGAPTQTRSAPNRVTHAYLKALTPLYPMRPSQYNQTCNLFPTDMQQIIAPPSQ